MSNFILVYFMNGRERWCLNCISRKKWISCKWLIFWIKSKWISLLLCLVWGVNDWVFMYWMVLYLWLYMMIFKYVLLWFFYLFFLFKSYFFVLVLFILLFKDLFVDLWWEICIGLDIDLGVIVLRLKDWFFVLDFVCVWEIGVVEVIVIVFFV